MCLSGLRKNQLNEAFSEKSTTRRKRPADVILSE